MVARGALIKPWIFTEIKERREWDISARERLEHVKKVNASSFIQFEPLSLHLAVVRGVWTEVSSFTCSLFITSSSQSHFGTDTAGVNTTRRYLCEALSFQYRYIPIGLLEHLPGRLNDRAPAFKARNDLGLYSLHLPFLTPLLT